MTLVAIEMQQFIFYLLSCMSVNNIKYCTKMLLCCIYVAGNNKTYLGLHVKCLTLLSDINHIFIKARANKFHGNPSGDIHAGKQMDVMNLTGPIVTLTV
jgi:hypothetical protein